MENTSNTLIATTNRRRERTHTIVGDQVRQQDFIQHFQTILVCNVTLQPEKHDEERFVRHAVDGDGRQVETRAIQRLQGWGWRVSGNNDTLAE